MSEQQTRSVSNFLIALESAQESLAKRPPVTEFDRGFYNAIEHIAAAYEMREPKFLSKFFKKEEQ